MIEIRELQESKLDTVLKSKKYKNRRRIEYEDDLVLVFDDKGKEIYRGIEDYEPMSRENWRWDNYLKAYVLTYNTGTYTKICIE